VLVAAIQTRQEGYRQQQKGVFEVDKPGIGGQTPGHCDDEYDCVDIRHRWKKRQSLRRQEIKIPVKICFFEYTSLVYLILV